MNHTLVPDTEHRRCDTIPWFVISDMHCFTRTLLASTNVIYFRFSHIHLFVISRLYLHIINCLKSPQMFTDFMYILSSRNLVQDRIAWAFVHSNLTTAYQLYGSCCSFSFTTTRLLLVQRGCITGLWTLIHAHILCLHAVWTRHF